MARITVEDCLQNENNRFALVLLAAKRAKQILQGSKVLSTDAKGNKAIVSSLREIAEGQVGFMSADEVAAAKIQEEREAEERAKEAFEKLSQTPAETNGSSIADKLRASVAEEEDDEIIEPADEDESVVAKEEIEDEDDSDEDDAEEGDIDEVETDESDKEEVVKTESDPDKE